MTRLVLALAGLVIAAAGAWLLQDPDPDQPTAPGGTENRNTDPNQVTPARCDNGTGLSAEQIKANLLAQRSRERGEGDDDGQTRPQNPQAIDYWSEPDSAYFQTWHTQDMARLKWEKNTARGRFVTAWFHKKVEVDSRLFDGVSESSGDAQLAAMRAYNEFTDSKRRELVQAIGLGDANHVLNTFAIYNFDLEKRNWFRIDASGQKVPFLNPDHDIWENGETGGAPWANHR